MMQPSKIPPQILRLILLTIGIAVAYFAARTVLTPETFGQYGWYRGAALATVADREPVFAGRQSCSECHEEEVDLLRQHEHKTLSCETCHGAARDHADDPDAAVFKPADDTCLRCHRADPARPDWFRQVNAAEHYAGDSCIECHMPHQPNEMP